MRGLSPAQIYNGLPYEANDIAWSADGSLLAAVVRGRGAALPGVLCCGKLPMVKVTLRSH